MIWLGNYLKGCEPDIPVVLHLGGEKKTCTAGDAAKFVEENTLLKHAFVGSTHVNTSTDNWILEIWPEDEHEIG